MPHYEVSTSVGIDADTPREAALAFAHMMLGWTTDGYLLTVRDADDTDGEDVHLEALYLMANDLGPGDCNPASVHILDP